MLSELGEAAVVLPSGECMECVGVDWNYVTCCLGLAGRGAAAGAVHSKCAVCHIGGRCEDRRAGQQTGAPVPPIASE
jgi:hypothetical protein